VQQHDVDAFVLMIDGFYSQNGRDDDEKKHLLQLSNCLLGWWLGLAPATLEFWVRFPNERNQGKQDATLC
jgi:hypothetical protein